MKPYNEIIIEAYFKYLDFIAECKNKLYPSDLLLHSHHIIAKHLGGTNEKSNLILLSVEDHCIAHLLLAELFPKDSLEYTNNLRSARILGKLSIKDKETMAIIAKAYEGEGNPFYGRRHSEETKQMIRDSNSIRLKDKTYEDLYENPDVEKQKRAIGVTNAWKRMSEEERKMRSKKLSESKKGTLPPNCMKVLIEGVVYNSLAEAYRLTGISPITIRKRINKGIYEKVD